MRLVSKDRMQRCESESLHLVSVRRPLHSKIDGHVLLLADKSWSMGWDSQAEKALPRLIVLCPLPQHHGQCTHPSGDTPLANFYCSLPTVGDVLFVISNDSRATHLVVSLAAHVPITSCYGMRSSLDLVRSFHRIVILAHRLSHTAYRAADTPFEDGTFKLLLTFDESYPNKPPTVKFLSRMFHPNVYANGELCLDILQNRWSPTYDVAAILTSIQSLLHDPNPNSPANAEAAQLYRENMKEYVRRVRATVEDSWLEDDEKAAVGEGGAQ